MLQNEPAPHSDLFVLFHCLMGIFSERRIFSTIVIEGKAILRCQEEERQLRAVLFGLTLILKM